MKDLEIVHIFFNRHEAESAAALLKDGGIEAMVLADDCGGFRPDMTLGLGNVKLLVIKENFKKAKEILVVLDHEYERVDGKSEVTSIETQEFSGGVLAKGKLFNVVILIIMIALAAAWFCR